MSDKLCPIIVMQDRYDGDIELGAFRDNPPTCIAVGATPEEAVTAPEAGAPEQTVRAGVA